jgi:hypothetical protein
MIFCLGDDILESLSNNQNIPDIEDLFQQFTNIIVSKYNILIAQSSLIITLGKKIIENEKHSNTIKRVIRHCYKTYTSNYQLLDKVNLYFIITLENYQNNDNNIYLCKDYIKNKNIELNFPISFLSENSKDCSFYKYICESYMKPFLELLSGISIKLDIRHGGGETIHDELKRLSEEGKIILAICDSDKFYPDSNFGKTATKLENSFNNLYRLGNLHVYRYILEVAEKENLVMPSEYLQYYETENDKKTQTTLEKFLEIEHSDFNNFLYFLDFKSGIKKKIIMENREYFRNLFEKFPRIFELDNFNNLDSRGDNDIIIKGTKRTILPDLYNSLNINTSPNVYIYNFRKKIADLVFCFGISQQKQILI